jgi:hypothetical protein
MHVRTQALRPSCAPVQKDGAVRAEDQRLGTRRPVAAESAKLLATTGHATDSFSSPSRDSCVRSCIVGWPIVENARGLRDRTGSFLLLLRGRPVPTAVGVSNYLWFR